MAVYFFVVGVCVGAVVVAGAVIAWAETVWPGDE